MAKNTIKKFVQSDLKKEINNKSVVEDDFTDRKDEQQLNVWLPKELIIKLKVKGAQTSRSLKDMVSEAINQYLISTN